VLIRGCQFDTGDDCIALKSGRNNDGRRLTTPIQNVVIEDCVMRAGHGGVVIGSEISGGARNIFARRLVMNSPDLERGLRIKTNTVRGGLIENVALWDIDIGQVKDAVVINFYYEEGDAGQFLPQVRGIRLRDFRVNNATRAFELRGLARAPIVGLSLERVQIRCQTLGVIEHVQQFDGKQVQINGKPWQPNSVANS
jgi:polygalacturonase